MAYDWLHGTCQHFGEPRAFKTFLVFFARTLACVVLGLDVPYFSSGLSWNRLRTRALAMGCLVGNHMPGTGIVGVLITLQRKELHLPTDCRQTCFMLSVALDESQLDVEGQTPSAAWQCAQRAAKLL